MSNMIISVEFLAGTNIEDAITEAKQKAQLFDVACIHFNFNGVPFSIGRDANVQYAKEEYRRSLQELDNRCIVT